MTTFTAATERLIQLADDLGLRPVVDAPWRGSVRVVLNGEGTDAGFGALFVGARTGRVLRLTLRKGADDPRPARYTRHVGYRAARSALVEYRCYAVRVGLIPDPDVQDAGHVPSLSDDDLAPLLAALLGEREAPEPQPPIVTSGRATWHAGVVRVLTPAA